MSYKIKSVKVDNEILMTKVEYTLKDGTIVDVLVPHFMPKTKQDVLTGIENREVSEQTKLDAKKINEEIKKQIDNG